MEENAAPAAGDAGHNEDELLFDVTHDILQMNARNRLFHAIFMKVASYYVEVVPKWLRTSVEIIVLMKALVLFTTLSYIHFTFSKSPMDCLDSVMDSWPRDGILQVQIMKNDLNITANKFPPYFASKYNYSWLTNATNDANSQCPLVNATSQQSNETNLKITEPWLHLQIENGNLQKRDTRSFHLQKTLRKKFQGYSSDFPTLTQLLRFYAKKPVKDDYVFEYSLEYGFLRLSRNARERLKIPISLVVLDPKKDKCFGDSLSRFILDKFLGYDDIIMGSIKRLAERENNEGYMKNVVTGEHYKFITLWMGRTSYFVSFLLMFVFTIAISTLLRFCHQQIFIFLIHVLHDWNIAFAFLISPLFTIVLSLVGMEAIMAEFFNDTTTSFYVILIVWAADQFDSICCHTKISQKYWPRFFFLYQFVFYAYHYRFNGQYSTMALAASWFFIQHSMLYFLHNYEIPAFQAELVARDRVAAGNHLDNEADLPAEEVQAPNADQSAQEHLVLTAENNEVSNGLSAEENSALGAQQISIDGGTQEGQMDCLSAEENSVEEALGAQPISIDGGTQEGQMDSLSSEQNPIQSVSGAQHVQ